jgi:DNA-binding LacI/PurR family transcriptional regulator
MNDRRPRLIDVADHAGVSMKTVSNVINGYQHVSAPMRAKVMAAIDELGYQPNLSARNLARGRAGLIALVVPRLDMPYFSSLAGLVIDEAHRSGSVVLIEQTGGDLDAERKVITAGFGQRVDGMIFSPASVSAAEIAARTGTAPMVLLGEQVADIETVTGVPHLAVDNEAAARLATEHLLGLGRTRLAMIGGSRPLRENSRYRGFRQALIEAGLRPETRWVRSVKDVRGIDGEQAMAKIISSGQLLPDGLFCATDWLALGAIRTLHRHGIRVPEDIAVIGFDDIPYGAGATPSLSTIATDRAQIARLAVQLLDADRPIGSAERTVDFRLIARESTAGLTR